VAGLKPPFVHEIQNLYPRTHAWFPRKLSY
jgi:hypothetical protein